MTDYSPFLLPVLRPLVADIPETAANPLEEEAIYNNLTRKARPRWQQLADLIRKEYGLVLLFELPPEAAVECPGLPKQASSPNRFLIVREGGRDWFVLEHPVGLPLFDCHGQASQQPAIAKPSLFARLAAGQSGHTVNRPERATHQTPGSDGSTTSFHRFLGQLMGGGKPSDWHLEPTRNGFRSRLRIEGRLSCGEILPRETGEWLIHSVMNKAGLDEAPKGNAFDGSFTFPDQKGKSQPVRVSLVPAMHGYALVMRFLNPGMVSGMENLGLSSEQIALITRQFAGGDGLWLVAGPTGSGKSTTLHALLRLSVAANEKVLAVEDPVEEELNGVQQVQVGRPAGLTFATAMRAFMRQSPDCLLVGEIRDSETAAIALQAARTGHRLLSSIHARDTPGVLRRFADFEQPAEQLAAACQLLIHQRLVPLLCCQCRKPWRVGTDLRQAIEGLSLAVPSVLYSPGSCPQCHAGFQGRTGIFSMDSLSHTGLPSPSLLPHAWALFGAGKTDVASILPFLPISTRGNFTVCHV